MVNLRENAQWVKDLAASSEAQTVALEDLRLILLRGLARSFPQQDDAFLEDSVQVSLVKILNHLGSFVEKSRFTTWAMSIAVRTALSDLRHRRWQHVSLDEAAGEGSDSPALAVDTTSNPARHSAQSNVIATLHELIRTALTPIQRAAILAEIGGMPLEEIALKQGSNLNATYKLLHDARKRLKTALAERDIGPDDVAQLFAQ